MPFQEDTIQEQGILSKFWLKELKNLLSFVFKPKKRKKLGSKHL